MIEHIIKANESIYDILNQYHVELVEIKEHNSHITDFNNLIGGTKLLIPYIRQEVEQVLQKTEAFIMDYYPKISDDIITNINEVQDAHKVEIHNAESDDKRDVRKPDDQDRRMPYPGIIPPKAPYKGR